MDVAAVETIEAGASEVAEDTSFDPDKRIDVEQNQDTDNTSSEYDVDKRIEVTDTSMDSENYDPDKRIDVSENNDKHLAEENEYNPDDRVTFDTFKDSIRSEKMVDIYVPEQGNEQIDSENTTFDVDKRIDVNQNEVTDDNSEYDPDKRIEISDVDGRQKDEGYTADQEVGSNEANTSENMETKFEGLTNEEKSKIKEEMGWSDEIVDAIKNMDQYEIYKNADLHEAEINGRKCLVKDIDLDYVDIKTEKSNRELMSEGKSPIDSKTGEKIELHHMGQHFDGPFAELTENSEHGDGNHKVLHTNDESSWRNDPEQKNQYQREKSQHWKTRVQGEA